MRAFLSVITSLILLTAAAASPAMAQGVAPSTDSVSRIAAAVSIGQRIMVRDDSGRKVQGVLASLSPNSVVVLRRRRTWFFRQELVPASFAPDRVERIEAVDSRWQGQLIGAAAGVAATALLVAAAPPDDDQYAALLWFFPGPLLVIGGTAIGGAIDGAHNRTVYERRPPGSTFMLVPEPSRRRLSVMARLSF